MRSLVALLGCLLLTGCAAGSGDWPLQDVDGSDVEPGHVASGEPAPWQQPAAPITGAPVGTCSTAAPVPGTDTGDVVTDDIGIVSTIDELFWSLYTANVHDGNQVVDVIGDCSYGGTVYFIGSVVDDTMNDQLNVNVTMQLNGCKVPNVWSQIDLGFTGNVAVAGTLAGGPYEDDLTFTSDELSVAGKMRYDTGEVVRVNEPCCSMSFLDDFHESYGIGGLFGTWCGRPVAALEADPSL